MSFEATPCFGCCPYGARVSHLNEIFSSYNDSAGGMWYKCLSVRLSLSLIFGSDTISYAGTLPMASSFGHSV